MSLSNQFAARAILSALFAASCANYTRSHFSPTSLAWAIKHYQRLTKNPIELVPARLFFVLLLGALLVSGCSGSSNSSSDVTETAADNTAVALDEFENTTDTATGSTTDTTQGGVDPLIRYTTQVKFDITVPVYVSDELQVGLVWGEKDIRAMWVGDELWTVSENFQTDTEHLLSVTFYDKNGDVILGIYEANYRTGFNDAESYLITADQFDTSGSDDDGDGFSNLAELIAGTDPFVDESELLESNLVGTVGGRFWFDLGGLSAAAYYESELLTLALPIDIHEEEIADNRPFHFESTTRDIDISVDGNGTYSKIHYIKPGQDQPYRQSSVGTRSLQGDTVGWSGTQLVYRSSLAHNAYVEEVFETLNTNIERELVQKNSGTVTRKRGPIENTDSITKYNYEIVLDLDSMDSENTCAVLHGNFSQSFEQLADSAILTEQSLGRSSTDENWAWTNISNGAITKGEAIDLNQRFYCNFPII